MTLEDELVVSECGLGRQHSSAKARTVLIEMENYGAHAWSAAASGDFHVTGTRAQ